MTGSGYSFIQSIPGEIQIPAKGILSQTLFNDDAVKVIVFGFAAGEELAAHTAPMQATIQVLSGDVTLVLGTESYEAGPGSFANMTPKLVHSIVARAPAMILLTLLKAARTHGG